jgi:probable addiction module antidote protein
MQDKTAPYDVAEFLETPEEMDAYLEACIEASERDADIIAKALGDIARAKGMTQIGRKLVYREKVCTKHSLGIEAQTLSWF